MRVPEKEWSWVGRIEWGLVVTVLSGACAGVWKWLTGHRKDAEDLEDSRIGVLSKSWKLQQDLQGFWEARFTGLTQENAALMKRLATLESNHAACEAATTRLTSQNADQARQIQDQAEQIERLSAEVESLKKTAIPGGLPPVPPRGRPRN
jgi:uncharacterized coiled-coil protein SlyX